MKKWFALALLGLVGCMPDEQPHQQKPPIPQNVPMPTDKGMGDILETFTVRENDPRNTLIVLKYGGKKHVFLVHTTKYNQYRDQSGGPIACSESMVKVGEYDLDEK